MNRTTQHISPNPALDFANAVLEETDGAREIIYMLHDIAQGVRENATTNDRMKASGILMDRGLGKCPKQSPAARRQTPKPNPAPETEACPEPAEEERGACPERSRRVTQLDRSLHDSLGPPPSAQPEGNTAASPESFDPYSIQQHILEITDGCRTLMTVLTDICRAPDDDSKACPEQEPALSLSKPVLSKAEGGRRIKESHRVKAGQMLIDRLMGTDPNALRSALCPECRRKWTTHPGSHDHPVSDRKVSPGRQVRYVDPEALAKARAEIQRMKDEGILTPDPNAPKRRITVPEIPEDFDVTPYLKEEAAAFWADIELRLERQKQWPEIEERRRKKLAQIYPSHSEDDKPPDL